MRSLTPHTVSWSFIDHVFFCVNNAVIRDVNGVVYYRVPETKVLCSTLDNALWMYAYGATWLALTNDSLALHPNLARFIREVHPLRK